MANVSNFRTINFPAMLRETLTDVFSLSKAGQATWGYKFCAAVLAVFLNPLADFETFRQKENLIANCKWQVGQLTYVLNYLYDRVQKRIYITQSISTPVFFWQFPYDPSPLMLGTFDEDPLAFLQTFGSNVASSVVTIHVPVAADVVDLTASVSQIAMDGIPYEIETF